jgi:hypothetical protein
MTETKDANPTFFTESQRVLVCQVLNRIVPAGDGFPAAGDLAVVDYLDDLAGRSAKLKRTFGEVLSAIERAAAAGGPTDFTTLSDEGKDEALRRAESDMPEPFATLVKQTYNGYYTDPTVLELLGPEVRPPQPLGHDVEPGDLRLLDSVRKRGPVFRQV